MDPIVVVIALVVAVAALVVLRTLIGRVTVFEYERAVRYRNGRLAGVMGPGRHWIYRPATSVVMIDIRQSVVTITGQEVVTSDGVSVKLSLAVRQRVVDPVVALRDVDDYQRATYTIVQIALREAVAPMPVDHLLEHRAAIGPDVLARSAALALALGVEIVSVDVRDLMFPGPLKTVFAHVVEARQQGLAALERARGETAALRNLANAARMVDANPSLLQLRLLQQLESTSGNTIVLGMPSTSTPLPLTREPAGEPPALDSGAARGLGTDE